MSPSSTPLHQKILLKIAMALSAWVENNNLGDALIAPCGVYLSDGNNVVQPDIIFISSVNNEIIKTKGIFGTPDLIVKLLSSNANYDKAKKFDLYQKNQMPEYIMIDPETKELWHYVLTNDVYVQITTSEKAVINISSLNTQISF